MEQIQGIDVSKWQGEIDWTQLMATQPEIKFAIIKATEGVGYTDPKFKRNWEAAKAAGLIRGAYHFARVSVVGLDKLKAKLSAGKITQEQFNELRDEGLRKDAEAEASWFAEVMGPLGDGDLNPVLDIEWDKRATVKAKEIVFWVHAFLTKLEALTDRLPIIYTGVNYWRYKLAKTKTLERYTLWHVQYTTKRPIPKPIQLPLGSKDPTWRWPERLWQWSHTRPVAGVGKAVDENRFLGDMTELQGLSGWRHPNLEPGGIPLGPSGEEPEDFGLDDKWTKPADPPPTVEAVQAPWFADVISWFCQLFTGISRRSKTPMKNPERDLDHETRIE
jgi:lysozyme